ncbi:MAG: hypothetical protein DI617_08420 [Streptococcus pyogenes]|nr:MAG: hypothetical protein DI617_08420 [Streptococcus pyogenes]
MNITRITATRNPIAADPNYPDFPFTVEQLTKVCNYSSRAYTRKLVEAKYIEGLDYIVIENKMRISTRCLTFALTLCRSKPGVNYTLYPQIGPMVPYLQELAKLKLAMKAERRRSRQNTGYPQQLQLKLNVL